MTELSLFPLDEERATDAVPIRPGTRNGVRWSTHSGRVRCDDCRADQIAGRLATVATAARWRLQSEGADDRYLCYQHARTWREHDPTKGGA